MADLDALAPNYRRAQHRWPLAPTLANCYEALKACYAGNGHGLVEQVKSFVECVCITLIGEFRQPIPSNSPSTTDLLVAALGPLELRSNKGAGKLAKVLSGFNKIADALTEMRNEAGPVAHGKDGFLDAVTVDHARAFLHAGDAILGLLLNAFEGKQPDLIATREPYERFRHLNERIDRAVNIEARVDEDGERPVVVFSVATGRLNEAIELRVEPSRLLYGIDREAYIEVLRTAELAAAEIGEATERPGETVLPKAVEEPISAALVGPVTELVPTYRGVLQGFSPAVSAFLVAEGVPPTVTASDGKHLLDSLLATAEQNMGLDWKEREPIRARLKVSCKRVLVQFGVTPTKADTIAERLVSWFQVQIPDDL